MEDADQSLSQSHRLVEARTRFVQLSKEHQLSQFRLQAHTQAQEAIAGWSPTETSQEKQSRLELRIQEVEKELQTRRSKRAICQGVVTALDHSLLVNSHLQTFSNPPMPSRHAVVQRDIVERDQISFRLLKIQKALSKVSAEILETRKEISTLNRKNAVLVKSLRERYRSPEQIIKAGTDELKEEYRELQDEILVLRTRLSIISPVLQSLISEFPLPYYSPSPLSPESLLGQVNKRRSHSQDETALVNSEPRENEKDCSNDRWMGLMLFAGQDWNKEWDPLVDGVGSEENKLNTEIRMDES
ncbi:hypothetical protein JCM3765_001997 [Sporobolomyces pararoseus]